MGRKIAKVMTFVHVAILVLVFFAYLAVTSGGPGSYGSLPAGPKSTEKEIEVLVEQFRPTPVERSLTK